MTILITPDGGFRQLNEHLDALRRLIADIERLRETGAPDPLVLADAPIMEQWALSSRPAPCLVGYPEGHPKLRSSRKAATSDLWVFAPDLGYARTLSRYYRLGIPATSAGETRQ